MRNWYYKTFYSLKNYKCLAFVAENENKIVEAFQIEEYTRKRAFKMAYEILKLKFPNLGLDIRIIENEKYKGKNK